MKKYLSTINVIIAQIGRFIFKIIKKYLPIIIVVIILIGGFIFINKSASKEVSKKSSFVLNSFSKPRNCARLPKFLYDAGFRRPIIDLSQMKYKAIAFYQGNKVFHKKAWERFDYFGTYAIDNMGNIYLAPMPFISIKPTTFNLQKNIYKMDSFSGKIDIFMHFDDIKPSANNPYGIISLVYDCSNNTLYASAIDKTSFDGSKGRIYHIDIKSKEIIDKIDNFDALTLAFIQTKDKKYLIAGSAFDSGVYIFVNKKPIKLFDLPNSQLRVRKIKVLGKDRLKLEAIKFSYTLIAQSTNKQRQDFEAIYNSKTHTWKVLPTK